MKDNPPLVHKSSVDAYLKRKGLVAVPKEPTLEAVLAIAHSDWSEDSGAGKLAQRRLGLEVIPPRSEYEQAAGIYIRLIAAAQEPVNGE